MLRVFIGAGILQIALTAKGLRGWACPIDTLLGIPCPGCRLGTALTFLVQGDWQAAVQQHAFAPVALLGLLAMAVFCFLPAGWQGRAANQIAALESKTGITGATLLGGLLYWGVRLLAGD